MTEFPASPEQLQVDLARSIGPGYRITGRIEGGGMSTLFRAEEVALHRQVIIKVLAPELAERTSVERFRQEIAISVALQHPNIVPILSAGEVSGLPYLVMPWIEGDSLRKRLARGPLSVRQAIEILQDVLRALAHAHEHGVIHRDIKPDNILLTASAAVVTDFGIARALAHGRNPLAARSAPITADGTTSGTLAYMSPEQLVQDPTLDHRTDLYALGVVGYEMLAGAPPFVGAAHQVLRAQVAEAPVPLRRRRAGIPAGLETLILWCLEKDPAHRPGSAKDMLYLLQDSAALEALGKSGRPIPSGLNRPEAEQSWAGRTASGIRASVDGLRQDLRLAVRSLRRSPVLSLAAALTLTLGIGANTAMFGVIDALFFRPPAHVIDPDRVVRLQSSPGSIRTYPRYVALRDQARTMTVASYYGPRPISLGRGTSARSFQTTLITADFLPLLGVTPVLGRGFAMDEDRPGSAAHVVLVSEEFWRQELDASPAALGRPLDIGQQIYTVVGVLPAGFTGLDMIRTDIWLPMSAAAPGMLWKEVLSCEACSWLQPVARLSPGVTAQAAIAEATSLFRSHRVQRSDSSTIITVGPLNQPLGIDAVRGVQLSTWLAAACAIVLLIACVNVANLLLARAARRQREMAVRLALGSRRGQLVRQLYLESGLLAAMGGVGALIAAVWTGPLLRALLLPKVAAAPIDGRVMLFTSAVVLATILIAGLAPAIYTTTPDLSSALKTGAREGNVSRSAVQSVLLAGQIALTVVLLTGAGLFVRSLSQVRAMRLGFDADQVMIASPHLEGIRPTRGDIDAEFERIRDQVSRVPGVTATALSIGSPFRYNFGVGFSGPGVDSMPDMNGPYISAVDPDYFRTLGTRVVRGRGFSPADNAGAGRVLIVSESFARLVWPGLDPIGRCLSIGLRTAPCREVVGVVEDGRQDRVTEPAAQTFVPLTQADDQSLASPHTSIMIRTDGPAAALVGPVQRAIQGTSTDLPFIPIEPMTLLMADQMRPWELGASLFGLFGALALLLGAVGIYGVLSYAMSQRTREIGVRSALGAQRNDLVAMVVGRGVRVALVGILAGGVGALLAGRALSSLVFGVSPYDPRILGGVGLVLLAVSVAASLIPAWRASRVDPMVALREE